MALRRLRDSATIEKGIAKRIEPIANNFRKQGACFAKSSTSFYSSLERDETQLSLPVRSLSLSPWSLFLSVALLCITTPDECYAFDTFGPCRTANENLIYGLSRVLDARVKLWAQHAGFLLRLSSSLHLYDVFVRS